MPKLLLVIDIQNEYIVKGRPYYIEGIGPSLKNAKSVLEAARENGMTVWHMAHKQEGNVFSKDSSLSNFVADFIAKEDEKIFNKKMYSCFSSSEFTAALNELKPEEIIVIGYGTSKCCLCTIIDGIHRGYKFTLVEDATAAKREENASEEVMYQSSLLILKQYANLVKSADLIPSLESSNNERRLRV